MGINIKQLRKMADDLGADHLLTAQETAEILKISYDALSKTRSKGTGPDHVTHCGRIHYRLDALLKYFEEPEAKAVPRLYVASKDIAILDSRRPDYIRLLWLKKGDPIPVRLNAYLVQKYTQNGFIHAETQSEAEARVFVNSIIG